MWETPIHVLRMALSGKGSPPSRALEAAFAGGLRAAGLRCAGLDERAAGGRDEVLPVAPLARVAAAVLERWLLDGRDPMVAPYVKAPLNSRVTRATGEHRRDDAPEGADRVSGGAGGLRRHRVVCRRHPPVSDSDTRGPVGGQPAATRLSSMQVMSASDKPRLAGQQPSSAVGCSG
ncbi:hypothetical protein GCM10028802_13250 [Terrabacter terrigena]